MGILSLVWQNFRHRTRTLHPSDMPAAPAPFRGLIEQDVSLCTGCKACATVCAPRAISFDEANADGLIWNFSAGRCSFCGLCVKYCPTQAISNNGKLPPVTGEKARLTVAHEIRYEPCTGCGRLIIPIPEPALRRIYGTALTETEARQRTLCQECKQKSASRHIRDAFLHPGGNNGQG